MTRSTIDFGIDLGTTNSSIAVVVDGRPQPIRNNEQHEITPSAVIIDRNGAISVGRRAYEQAEVRPETVAREFKRAMGTEKSFTLSGRAMTPEELSAEVLKALRADVQARLGESIDAAVITVPALFTLAACEATGRAARLAGLEHAPLLQEPIAAGLAYGAQDADASGYWLVYDLGGGTFDASLMTLREGRLQVVDHAGDDFLGGKNLDDALVDYVVEELRRQHRFGGTVRGENPRYRRTYAHLKRQCEEAKIRLSREPHAVVEVVNVTDDDDNPVDTYIDVSRERYEQLVAPLVSRTTKIIHELLETNRVPASAVRRVLMVGGPTLTPYVRQRVRDETGIELETRFDPMTVVAQGAALYAASVFRDKQATVAAAVPPGGIRMDLRYSPVSDDTEVMVGGRLEGGTEPGITIQVERTDGGWSSGRVPVANGTFVSSVVLRPREVNTFVLRAFDRTGGRIPVVPDSFAITQGLVVDDPPPFRAL